MDKIVAVYKKCVLFICHILEIVAAASLVGMLITVLIHVIMRYFFGNAPGWGEELARQFVVIFAFIGVVLGVRDKGHIALTLFAEGPLKKILLPIEIFVKFLTLILGIMMSVFMGPYITMLRYNRLPGTGIPISYFYILPTVIGIMVALVSLYQIYDYFRYGTDEQQGEIHKAIDKEGL